MGMPSPFDRDSNSERRPGQRARDAGRARAAELSLSDRDAGLAELFNVLYRQKWMIVAVVLVSVVLTGIILQQLTPRYSAETLLLIETRQTTIPNLDSVLTGLAGDDQGVRSEAEVLRSRGLAAATVRLLALEKDPEFNAALRPPGLLERIPGYPKSRDRSSGETDFGKVVDAFLERLDVHPVTGSRVISVNFTSVDRNKAALVANTLADQYLLSHLETKFEAAKVAHTWLNGRVEELREQVAISEQAVEDFRRDAGLLQAEGVTLTAQQMAELNGQLILARAETAQASARLRQVSRLVESPDGIATASEVLDSQLIQRLKEQQAQIERRVAELAAEYGPSHPRMIQLRAEQQDLQDSIAAEVNKIVASLNNEVAIASAREASLEDELGRLKDTMAQSNDSQIQLRALEREAEANQALLATLLARYKEVSSQDEMNSQQADARIISRADAPSNPSFPNKPFLLGIAVLLSGLLAIIAVFVRESAQRGFVSGEQIEALTGLTALGFVPLHVDKSEDGGGPADYVACYPRSALSQSLRTAFWSTTLSLDEKPRQLVITSAHPEEGKTTVALGIARSQAQAGQRTLLIDADTRNPSVHALVRQELKPGLVDVLLGDCSEPPIVRDTVTSLDVLCAGRAFEDPLPLLDSSAMDDLLRAVGHHYDLVVIDTPPLMAASDACALSKKVDTTVLIVRWVKTPREVVRHVIRQLTRAGGHVAGALVTMVDVKKHAAYRYGDSGAYHGSLHRYYSDTGRDDEDEDLATGTQ
jgi:capsular exopolysaccharide synthesis family protein